MAQSFEPLQRIGDAPKRASGTCIRAWPDAQFFDSPTIPLGELERLLRSKAVLLPGLEISLAIEGGETEDLAFRERHAAVSGRTTRRRTGVADVPRREVCPRARTSRPAPAPRGRSVGRPKGMLARESYVNLIPTPAGGTHETGFCGKRRDALKSFAEHHALIPKGVKLAA